MAVRGERQAGGGGGGRHSDVITARASVRQMVLHLVIALQLYVSVTETVLNEDRYTFLKTTLEIKTYTPI